MSVLCQFILSLFHTLPRTQSVLPVTCCPGEEVPTKKVTFAASRV